MSITSNGSAEINIGTNQIIANQQARRQAFIITCPSIIDQVNNNPSQNKILVFDMDSVTPDFYISVFYSDGTNNNSGQMPNVAGSHCLMVQNKTISDIRTYQYNADSSYGFTANNIYFMYLD